MRAIDERCGFSLCCAVIWSALTDARMDCESILRCDEAQLTFRDTFEDVDPHRKSTSSSLG
jgi:hypothetical protein